MIRAIALFPALMLTQFAVAETHPPSTVEEPADEDLCSGESPYPSDFALNEDQFSLEAAMVSFDRLAEIDAKMAETLWLMHNEQSVENAGPMFEAQIEAVTISHHNALQSIQGYLLKQAALTSEGEKKENAVSEFCDFVLTQYAAD